MADIDTLQVKITANAKEATSALNSLAGALKKVKGQLTGISKDGLSVGDRLSKSLNEMNGALSSINTGSIKKLQKLANALNDYSDALKRAKGLGKSIKAAEKAVSGSDVFDAASDVNVGKFATSESSGESETVQQKISLFGKLREAFKGIGKSLEGLKEKFKLSNTFVGKFVKSIGRIALYRAIRSALKGIGEAFEEGLKNAYGFSKQSETFTRLAETLDRIKSITTQMVNQLGAFWGEMKQFILPAVEWIVDKVRFAAEYLTELFAAINGEDTYLHAQYVAKEWDETIGKVKEYKHQLLGLDELNVLSDQKKSGTKADDTDYSKLYEELPVDARMKGIGGTISEFILNAKDVLFKWDGVTEDDISDKIQTGLLTIAGAVIGGVPGALIGYASGVGLTMIVDKLNPAEPGAGKYTDKGLFDILLPALNGLAGGVLGATFGLKGAVIGATVGAALTMSFVELLKSKKGKGAKKYKGQKLLDVLYPGLYGLAGAIIGSQYLGIKGALVGLSIGATVGFILKSFDPAEAKAQLGDSVLFDMLEPALSTLTGAWIGWKLGSKMANPVAGVLLGASIGLAIGMIIKNFDPAGKEGVTVSSVINSMLPLLNGFAAGLLVFAATANPTTALLACSMAISLSFMVQDIDWSWERVKNPTKELKEELLSSPEKRITLDSGGTVNVETGEIIQNESVFSKIKNVLDDTVEDAKNFVTNMGNTIANSELGQSTARVFKKVSNWVGSVFDGTLFEAGGGIIPANGSLFWAGESGAEFVGNIGSSSAVANTGQMTDAIYKAAYMGMSKALKENGGGGMSGFEPATTDDLFIAMKKKATNYKRVTGNPAFN